jgi:hypothetical protein
MSAPTKTPRPDTRTPAQVQADEAAASGNWEGFQTTQLMSEEEARALILQRRKGGTPTTITHLAAENVRLQPFHWKDKVFRILRCEYVRDHAEVDVVPSDPELAAELKRRVERDRFHTLTYYQGFGFISFPEDYAKYES